MFTEKAIVTAAGIASILWVNWYFLVATRQPAVKAAMTSRAQEATIVVDGGYAPSIIAVQAGRLVRIHFERKDRGNCTEEVVLADFGIRRFLATGTTTTVEFTPMVPGTFDFACGMGMVHGTLQVRA